jgi:hypothetical protein
MKIRQPVGTHRFKRTGNTSNTMTTIPPVLVRPPSSMSAGRMPLQATRDPRSARFPANSLPARAGKISPTLCEPVELVPGADRPVALSGPDIGRDPGHERHVVDEPARGRCRD